ncbi:MAG: hypothetical protein Fur0022_20270 [Anaerolineales bacterium]
MLAGTYDNPPSGPINYMGTWGHASNNQNAYLGTLSWTSVMNDSVSFTFTGERITRLYSMAVNRGTAKIYIDDLLVNTTYDNSTEIRRQVAKTWSLPFGTHTIEVRNGGGGYIDLDAFLVDIPYVASGSYDDPEASYTYIGSWTHHCCTGNSYNLTRSWSKNTGDAVTFTFYGNSITYVYTKAYNRGIATVTIDGNIQPQNLDLYSSTIQWQQEKTYNLAMGFHTIHIMVTGTKNPNSSDYFIDVDRFIVGP